MARLSARGEVVLFGCLVLALSVTVTHTPGLGFLFAVTPAIAAAAMIVVTQRMGPAGWMWLGLDRSGRRAWPFAVLIPVLALGSGLVVAWQLGWIQVRIPADIGVPRWALLAAAAIVVSSVGAVGEEIGWRGWLLPRLAPFGRVRTGLALGLLWGVWHIPAIGFDPLFVVAVVLIAFSIDELAVATRSVWPAAILHGTHNALVGIVGGLAFSPTTDLMPIMGTTGAATIVCYAVVAIAIVATRRAWPRTSSAFRDPPMIKSMPTAPIVR